MYVCVCVCLLSHTVRRTAVFKKPETDTKSLRHSILKLPRNGDKKSDTYIKENRVCLISYENIEIEIKLDCIILKI